MPRSRSRSKNRRRKSQHGGVKYDHYTICKKGEPSCYKEGLIDLGFSAHGLNKKRRDQEVKIWQDNVRETKKLVKEIKMVGSNAGAGSNILLTIIQMFTTDLLFIIKKQGGTWTSNDGEEKTFFKCMIDKFDNKVCADGNLEPGKGLFLTGLSDYKAYFHALDLPVKDDDYTRVYNEFRRLTKHYCENIRQTCTILDFMVKVFEKQKSRNIGKVFSNYIDRFDMCVRVRRFAPEPGVNRHDLGLMCNKTDEKKYDSFGNPRPTGRGRRPNTVLRKSGIPQKEDWLDNCTALPSNDEMIEPYGAVELDRIRKMCAGQGGWRRRFKSGADTFVFGAADKLDCKVFDVGSAEWDAMSESGKELIRNLLKAAQDKKKDPPPPPPTKDECHKFYTPKAYGVFAAGISGHSVEASLLFKLFSKQGDTYGFNLVIFLICLVWMINYYHHSLREIYGATTMVWPAVPANSSEPTAKVRKLVLELFKKNPNLTDAGVAGVYNDIFDYLKLGVKRWIQNNIGGSKSETRGATSIRQWAAARPLKSNQIRLTVDKEVVKELIGTSKLDTSSVGLKKAVKIYENLAKRPFGLSDAEVTEYDFLLETPEAKIACAASKTPTTGEEFKKKLVPEAAQGGGRRRTRRRKTKRRRRTRRKRKRKTRRKRRRRSIFN